MIDVIKSFRDIDYDKKVEVYRNLKYKNKVVYSVRQNSKVVAHCTYIGLTDVEFKVNEKGVKRIREVKQKSVVAFLKGYISTYRVYLTFNDLFEKVRFNPYEASFFFNPSGLAVHSAPLATLKRDGLYIIK